MVGCVKSGMAGPSRVCRCPTDRIAREADQSANLDSQKKYACVRIEALFPMFYLNLSVTGLLFRLCIRHIVHGHILPLGTLGTLYHCRECRYRLCAKLQDYPH